jgi:hypothetical protein
MAAHADTHLTSKLKLEIIACIIDQLKHVFHSCTRLSGSPVAPEKERLYEGKFIKAVK